jgi:hypothetical protein
MWKARGVFGALLLCQCVTAIIGASAITLGAGSALAQEPSDDPNTAEGWAWPRIKRGEVADFNARCETPALNPRDDKDARCSDDCRKLSIDFLRDLLTTRAPWREAIPFAGIQIKGARMVGDVLDLENANLIRSISILDSRIEAAIKLVRARTDSLIALDGSLMNGSFDAYGLHTDSDLSFNGTVFKNGVNLSGAKIDGSVDLAGAGVDGKLDASQARIGGYLSMNSDEQNKASFNEVDLVDAKVCGATHHVRRQLQRHAERQSIEGWRKSGCGIRWSVSNQIPEGISVERGSRGIGHAGRGPFRRRPGGRLAAGRWRTVHDGHPREQSQFQESRSDSREGRRKRAHERSQLRWRFGSQPSAGRRDHGHQAVQL